MSFVEDNNIDIYDPEQKECSAFNEFLYGKKTSNNKWMTKDGVLMDISDMTDSHLSNAINCSIRNGGKPYYLLVEFYKRKEGKNEN